jgi:hypothetical protein
LIAFYSLAQKYLTPPRLINFTAKNVTQSFSETLP